MYIKHQTYNFLIAIRLHVCDSWNITESNKTKKINSKPFYKISFSYGNIFFLEKMYYAFIVKQFLKNTFFESILNYLKKNTNGYRFNWCISPPKNQQKIPFTTPVLKYIFNFSCFVTSIISSHIFSICSSSSKFVL